LLKNVWKAERRRTMSLASPEIANFRESVWKQKQPSNIAISTADNSKEPGDLPSDTIVGQDEDNLYDASPLLSPSSQDEVPMSAEEAHRILWPDDMVKNSVTDPPLDGRPVERNEKYLLGDVSHIEDKTIMEEDNKHLRDEKDMALGLGLHKSRPKPS